MKKTLFLIIILTVFSFCFVGNAGASITEVLRPNSTGDTTGLSYYDGNFHYYPSPNNWQQVDEVVSDTEATYVYAQNSSYKTDIYNLSNFTQSNVEINNVKVYAQCKISLNRPDSALKIVLKTNGNIREGEAKVLTSSWTTYSETWTINPVTGFPWTIGEINALQSGVALRQVTSLSVRCTQVYVEVNYNLLRNVSGYAWSENIGWISFSSENCDSNGDGITDAINYSQCPVGQQVRDYGVNINSDGSFSGYAWSENIGWIDFAPSGPYPALPDYSAKIINENQIVGWARALAYGDGWDGWIKMSGAWDNGVSINTYTGDLLGYAWSDMVIGWISFSGINYKVKTSLAFNHAPNKPTIPLVYKPTGVNWSGGCGYVISMPSFYWEYSDDDNIPLGIDPQTAYQIRIDNDVDFGINSDGSAILSADEFRCSGVICSGGNSVSFSPLTEEWISWADYNKPYYWTVRVKDSNNAWSEWSDVAPFETQLHTYPEPDFIHTPESPSEEEEVTFTDLSTCYNSSNEIYLCKSNIANKYEWDFGDGETCNSTENASCRGDVTHSYSEVSEYTVTLKITDNAGVCLTQGDTPITTSVVLPKYKEIPPVFFINKFLAEISGFLKGLVFF